ncbi:hypothetical protein [Virgibacillus salexigens]|uniref:Uncharacterized protein n=1 Tax=Virgibacillus massiliensis TaxID=1462526 RepID=A0A024QI12_9BACI|nr:hypothetical protein [Virgibacillus massiliensis]CDQ41835.1 hypothetical protein BN990_04212 [Virgibacillus massiliensis]
MNPKLFSNQAVNGFKALYGDVKNTVTGDGRPMTYAIRNKEARQAYDKLSPSERTSHKFNSGTISKKRAAALAGSAYIAGDAAYRTASGGSAYRNSKGQSDIVGIPMV